MSFTAANTSCQLARVFGSNTSDKIDYGSPSHLDDLHQGTNGFTICAWVKRTGNGANQHIISKDSSTGAGRWVAFCDNGVADGELRFVVGRPGATNTIYTSSAGILPLNKWRFAAFTFNNSLSSGKVKIYVGGEYTRVSEAGYSLAQDGSGSLNTDAAASLYVGNLQRSTNFPFLGGIAATRLYKRALNRAEIETERRLYAAQSRHPACVFDVAVNTEFRDRRRSVLGSLSGTKPTQFLPQLRRWVSVGLTESTGIALVNSLEPLANSIGFSVSPEVTLANTFSSVINSLNLSNASEITLDNAIADTVNAVNFSISPRLTLIDILEPTSNTLGFYVSPVFALNQTFESLSNTLNFTIPASVVLINPLSGAANELNFNISGYTGLELTQLLGATNNALVFEVHPKLTIATTLSDVINALEFAIGGANAIALGNALEGILADLNLEVLPRLELSQTLGDVINVLDFSVSSGIALNNTLENITSSLLFTVDNSVSFSLENTLSSASNTLAFTVSPRLSLSGTLADVQTALAFTGYINPDIYFETIRIALKVNTSPSIAMKINLVSSIPLEL